MTPPTRIRQTSARETESARSRAARALAACLEEIEHFTRDRLEAACREHPDRADRIRERMKTLRAAGMTARLDRSPSAQTFCPGAASLANGEETASFEPIGPYQPLKEIGRGGQALVYLAEDLRLHRPVALKILRGFGPVSAEVMRRFRREAEVASRLDHPGICAVYDAGVERGIPYIAMRYVEGESLAVKIAAARKNGAPIDKHASAVVSSPGGNGAEAAPSSETSSLPTGANTRAELLRVVELIERTARALHAAHEAGIVHRDVKPGNIMVNPTAEPVLLDFGLAGEVAGELSAFTRSGDFFGTPAYMSPEQLLAHRIGLDRRTDVYSLAATLYECVTLRRPFEAPTRQALYHAIEFKDPPNARKLNPLVPADLKVVLDKAMEKDRDRRYPTAEAFADDLRRVQEGQPITARRVSATGRGIRWAKRRPFRAALVLALLIGLPLVTGLATWVITALPDIHDAWARDDEEQLESYLEQGFLELAEHENKNDGSHDRAVRSFDQALEINPSCVEAVAGGVLARYKQRNYDACRALLDRYPDLENKFLALRLLRALAGSALEEIPNAEEALQLLSTPAAALDQFLAGIMLMRNCDRQPDVGVFRHAVEHLKQAILTSRHVRPLHLIELIHAVGHIDDETDTRMATRALRTICPRSPNAWIRTGNAWQDIDKDRAIAAYRKALALEPRGWNASRKLARALRGQNKHPMAIRVLEEAIKRYPTELHLHADLCETLARAGRMRETLAVSERALARHRNSWQACAVLGTMFLEIGDHDRAIELLKKAVAQRPTQLSLCISLASALKEQGNRTLAVSTLHEAAKNLPDDFQACCRIAGAFCLIGEWKEACKAYARARRLKPESFINLLQYGGALMYTGRPRKALALFEECRRRDRFPVMALRAIAQVHLGQDRLGEAAQAGRRALQLLEARERHGFGRADAASTGTAPDPARTIDVIAFGQTAEKTFCQIADLLKKAGDFDGARRASSRCIQLNPARKQAQLILLCALDATGDRRRAEAIIRAAAKRFPNSAPIRCNLGAYLSKRGFFDQAEREFTIATRLFATHPTPARESWIPWFNLAGLYQSLGRLDEAHGAYEQVRWQHHPPPHLSIGHLLHDLGAFRHALEMIRKGHSLGSDPGRKATWRMPSIDSIRIAKRLVEFERRAESILQEEKPLDTAEDHALFALILRTRQEHAAATRFYAEAFARNPSLALPCKHSQDHRVDAARSAVLAGTGRGKSAAGLTLPARARLRRQALTWLEQELAYLVENMIPPRDAARAQQPGRYEVLCELRRWQLHVDLAGVRDGSELGLLPDPEREQWFTFWHRVEAMVEVLDDG